MRGHDDRVQKCCKTFTNYTVDLKHIVIDEERSAEAVFNDHRSAE